MTTIVCGAVLNPKLLEEARHVMFHRQLDCRLIVRLPFHAVGHWLLFCCLGRFRLLLSLRRLLRF